MNDTKPSCERCRDTGKRVLPNGEHSDYVDCSCQAATDRAELDVATLVFVQSYEGDLQNAPADTRWFVHQRAIKIERERLAARVAELERQQRNVFDLMCEWKTGRKTGDELADALFSSFASTPAIGAAPSAPAVEQQHQPNELRAWLSKLEDEVMPQHSDAKRLFTRVRGYLQECGYLLTPQAAEADKVQEAILNTEIVTAGSKGYAKAFFTGAREMREACAEVVSAMAAQAPVREVPGWLSIEAAPKDGREVLLWLPAPYSRIAKARWFDLWENWQEGEFPSDQDEYCGIGSHLPTHYMPLPAAPVQQEPKP